MGEIEDVLRRFPHGQVPEVSGNPFRLVCTLEEPASAEEIAAAWPDRVLPGEATDLWRACRRAALFEDADYGQWGIAAAVARRKCGPHRERAGRTAGRLRR